MLIFYFSGEIGFKRMNEYLGYAYKPMLTRIRKKFDIVLREIRIVM